ncbi:phage tail protein [Streptomyces sp. CAU 1734]|uniref:phage tail protein n=1 Tax=Streptomyces sp. CAU 1734 TaxID=3140360 RepID=UPI003260486E
MTCTPSPATFRLLDALVGWDAHTGNTPGGEPPVDGITGFDDPAGLRLAFRGPAPEGPTRDRLLSWFPDPRLAPGCGPRDWYLLTSGERPRLLRRDACGGWTPVWARGAASGALSGLAPGPVSGSGEGRGAGPAGGHGADPFPDPGSGFGPGPGRGRAPIRGSGSGSGPDFGPDSDVRPDSRPGAGADRGSRPAPVPESGPGTGRGPLPGSRSGHLSDADADAGAGSGDGTGPGPASGTVSGEGAAHGGAPPSGVGTGQASGSRPGPPSGRGGGPLRHPVAVAARGHRLVVVDSGRVLVLRREGGRPAGVIRARGARLAAPAPGDEVWVIREHSTSLWRFSSAGRFRGVLRTGVAGTVVGLRAGPDRTVWLLTDDGVRLRIHQGGPGRPFRTATPDELAAALPPSALTAAGESGFCLRESTPDNPGATRCFTWRGEPMDAAPPAPLAYRTDGRYLTGLIDSGISRCRWHRVRLDADLPPGTAAEVAVVVTEDGRHTPADWQTPAPGTTDFLVDQPPGRYLQLRLRLSSDGTTTPLVRRIRLDFPRVTSADLLPAAFREDPAADDFTERFLSLFDASLAELDRMIERYPALLDPAGVPDRVLPWTAGLLGLSYESGWDARTRRALLAAAPELYRRRGTPWALAEAVRIVFGVTPVIEEPAGDRRWARIPLTPGGSGPGLGSVRLFGRSSGRFRLDGSVLGAAPLRGYGDPDNDPVTAHAHRFRVLLPAGAAGEEALRRLVARQAPAHTVAEVRTGAAGFVVGSRSTVGVDTAFVPLPPPVLGGGRPPALNRDTVLRPGPRGPRQGIDTGTVSAVGVHTQVF